MRAGGQNGEDQPFGGGADRCAPPAEALGRPIGIATMRTGHVVRIGAVATAAIAALMGRDPLAAIEDLDRPGRGPQIDLLTDEAVRDGIKEGIELDMVVGADTDEAPLGELVGVPRQRRQGSPFHALEEVPATDAEGSAMVVR